MTRAFTFTVKTAPVPCARPRTVRAGGRKVRTFMPTKTVNYQRLVRAACKAAVPADWPMRERYRVTVDVCRARRAGDADNFLKSVLDGATGVAWDDDRGVYDAHVRLHDVGASGEPGVVVLVQTIEASE